MSRIGSSKRSILDWRGKNWLVAELFTSSEMTCCDDSLKPNDREMELKSDAISPLDD